MRRADSRVQVHTGDQGGLGPKTPYWVAEPFIQHYNTMQLRSSTSALSLGWNMQQVTDFASGLDTC